MENFFRVGIGSVWLCLDILLYELEGQYSLSAKVRI
jgi:hypothetical protein